MEHYLDNAATTKVCPEAAEAALKAMTELYGNPSSTHTKGREAKKLLDASRKAVSSALAWFMSDRSRHIDMMNTGSVHAASTNKDPLLLVYICLLNISCPPSMHE
jgi:hypothetical protein